MTPEASLPSTPDANSGTAEPSTSTVAESSTAGTSPASTEATAGSATAENVQENQSAQTQENDPLAGVPTVEELQAAAERDTPYAKSLIQLRNALEPLKTQFTELQERHKVFENFQEKFSAPEEIQSLVDMREALLGWEKAENGQLQPSTQRFIQQLDPQRAEFLFADLADGTTLDPRTGQQVARMDRALQFIASDSERRANALKILGAVEPSAVAPQWQATEEQLAVVKDELKDTFKKLPYDEREELATMSPEFVNNTLAKQKLQDDLIADREQRDVRDRQFSQQREQMLQQEAAKAGDDYVRSQLDTALTTFHNSVVEQCKLIEPLDPQNPPQGMDAQAIAQYNQQAEASNKAEAATVTLAVVGLINEQTRPFVLPLLKEIGVIDDKFLAGLDKAASGFGDNARNYGHLTYKQKLQANGNGYQPGADVTNLNNESSRNLKLLAYMANQIKGRLLEKKGQTFGMKATGHNQILNGVATSRANANGGNYDPTTAATQQPTGWMSRDEIAANLR